MNDFERTVSDIVQADYRSADVFKKYDINYCCAGQVPLDVICLEKNIDPNQVKDDLDLATREIRIPNTLLFAEWKIGFLIDYITNVHHHYIYQTIPSLGAFLQSFASSHGKKYPEMTEASLLFDKLSAILMLHNRHEDEIIFPYIRQIDSAHRRKETYGNLFVRTLSKPLKIVANEHQQIQDLLSDLRKNMCDFTFPEKACINYQVLTRKLEEFHNNLLQHKFFENKILFPRAIAIEQQLLQK